MIKIDKRDDLPQLIDHYELKIGVEVGVRHGHFSRRLLENSGLTQLYGVDKERDEDAHGLQHQFPAYKYIVKRSCQAALDFEDSYFDFVHIDADHSYEGVTADFHFWWQKLRVGGIFSGDDYIIQDWHPEGKFGVVEAIEGFCERHAQHIFVSGVEGTKADRRSWAQLQGDEIHKRYFHQSNNFQQVPFWYLKKE